MSNKALTLGFLTFLLLSGCGAKVSPSLSASPKDQAPPSIPTSVPAEDFEIGRAQGSLITLKRSALGKYFLLTPTLTIATNTPIVNPLQAKIVAFEVSGDRLALMSLNFQAVYDELPVNQLLQTFEIVEQDADTLTFRWAYGLSVVSQKDSLFSTEESTEEATNPQEEILPIRESFVRKAYFDGEALEIEQVARLQKSLLPLNSAALLNGKPLAISTQEITAQLNVRLEPYRNSETYTMRPSDTREKIGYLGIARMAQKSGAKGWFATRWDLSQGPITYSLSSNTPPEYVSAIREGLLYWNRVAGREIIRVETGLMPTAQPKRRRVIVYWIPWSQAGFAQGIVQSDPLTGEILSGSIYLTTTFEELARKQFERSAQARALGPHADGTQRAIQDYLRVTVAHEAGHTLGLRHNFAGNLGSELATAREHFTLWDQYVDGKESALRGAVISSSVMDYFHGPDSILLGAAILNSVLSYDSAAFQWGYSEQPVDSATLNPPTYCADSEGSEGETLGCQPYDLGRNPLQGFAELTRYDRLNLAAKLVRALTKSKNNLSGAAGELNPTKLAEAMNENLRQTVNYLGADSKVLAVETSMGQPLWHNKSEYAQKTSDTLKGLLDSLGGLPGWMEIAYGIPADTGTFPQGQFRREIEALLKSESFRTQSKLTEDEAKRIETFAVRIADETEEQVILQAIKTLTGETDASNASSLLASVGLSTSSSSKFSYRAGIGQDSWQSFLGKWGEDLLLGTPYTQEENIKFEDTVYSVQLPTPKYSRKVRLAAAKLYTPKAFGDDFPGLGENLQRVLESLQNRINLMAPSSLKGAAISQDAPVEMSVSPGAAEWFQEEMAVASALKKWAE